MKAGDFRLNRVTPEVDRGWVGGKNSKLPIHELSPRFVVGRRNRRQEGESCGYHCPECVGETIPGGFELPELVQQNEVTPRCDIALHRSRGGYGTGSIKVTHSRAGAQILKDRKSCSRHEVPQIAGLTLPIGEPVVFCDEPGQANIWPPRIGQRSKDGLNLDIRCAPDHADNFFHDGLCLAAHSLTLNGFESGRVTADD
jgi:hypothetical protein